MKTTKVLSIMLLGAALSVAPAMAQRGGGGHSSSSTRSSSPSMSSPSRSSSSMSSSPRSSSPSSSSMRSSTPTARSSSSSATMRSSSSAPSAVRSATPSGVSPSRSATQSRSGAVSPRSGAASAQRADRTSTPAATRGVREGASVRSGNSGGTFVPPSQKNGPSAARYSRSGSVPQAATKGGSTEGRLGATGRPTDSYARPGRPGGTMPPADRPMRPAPYFHHPVHHHMIHCHPIFWDPIPPRPWYWPGFWGYCNSYWYDYHVTDVVVVRDYVNRTYGVNMIDYAMAGDLMYALIKDGSGKVYLQIYDREDHLLAEQPVHKKYRKVAVDSENGGCWIMKKNDKDPLLFIYAEGQLLIYEAD